MYRILVLVPFVLFPAVRAAEPPDTGNSSQSRVRQVIESAEASVVAVVVARPPYPGQTPEDVAKGRLGEYLVLAEQRGRFGRSAIPDEAP